MLLAMVTRELCHIKETFALGSCSAAKLSAKRPAWSLDISSGNLVATET